MSHGIKNNNLFHYAIKVMGENIAQWATLNKSFDNNKYMKN